MNNMYMSADRAAKYAIKFTTIQFHESLEDYFRALHIRYINHNLESMKKSSWRQPRKNFKEYLSNGRGYLFKCSPTETNTKSLKPKQPKNLIKEEDDLFRLAGEAGFDINR